MSYKMIFQPIYVQAEGIIRMHTKNRKQERKEDPSKSLNNCFEALRKFRSFLIKMEIFQENNRVQWVHISLPVNWVGIMPCWSYS